ncbi:MAG: M1 family aminopeptidase [candidate division WOR-3 bacterium]
MKKYFILAFLLFNSTFAYLPKQTYQPWSIENKFVPYLEKYQCAESTHSYDVRHYQLNLFLPMTSGAYACHEIIKIVAKENNFDTFNLHFVNLVCDSVKRANIVLMFIQDNDRLKIFLDQQFNNGDTVKVDIFYHRNAGTSNRGFYFYTASQTGYHNLAYTTYSPYDARYWFACFDELWDKADEGCDFNVTVPDSFTVCSNGLLDSVRTNAGWKTFYWSHHYPIATYLMVFTATIYCTWSHWYHISPSESIEIKYYVWRVDSARSHSAFQNMLDMMYFFADSNRYGSYPFEKYGMNAVYPFLWGGMENQTMTMIHRNWLNGYDDGIAHELSHSWWGDMVTCFGWQNVWLNEGFATYSDALYIEHQLGHSAFITLMNQRANNYFSEDNSMRFPLYNPPFNQIFSWGHEYCKGSWVQHMLRYIEGDTTSTPGIFFQAMRIYGDSFKYKNAATEDYKRIHEQVTGLDLDWFFNEWIYQAGYPKYYYNWRTVPTSIPELYFVILEINQNNGSNAPAIFHMPLQVRFVGTNIDTTVTISINNNPQIDTFEFLFNQLPISVTLDPNNWILKRTYLGIEETDITLSTANNNFGVYPSPSFYQIKIDYNRNYTQNLSIVIFDKNGRKIKTFLSLPSNQDFVLWDSFDDNGKKVSAGIYFITFSTPQTSITKKVILLN